MLKNKSLRTRRFIAKYVTYVEIFGYLFVATLAAGIFMAWFYEVDDGVQHEKDPIIQPKETVIKENREAYVHRLFVTEPYQQVKKGDPIVEVVDRPKWVARYKAVSHLRAALAEWNALDEKLTKDAEKKAKEEALKAASAVAVGKDGKPVAAGAKPAGGAVAETGKSQHKAKKAVRAKLATADAATGEGAPRKKHKARRPDGARMEAADGTPLETKLAADRPAGSPKKQPRHARELPKLAQKPAVAKPVLPAAEAPAPPPVEPPLSTTTPGEKPATTPPGEKPAPVVPGEKPAPVTGETPAPAAPGEKPATGTSVEKPAAAGEKPVAPAPGEQPLAAAPGDKGAPKVTPTKSPRREKVERLTQGTTAKPEPDGATVKRPKAHRGEHLAQVLAAEVGTPAAGRPSAKVGREKRKAGVAADEAPVGVTGEEPGTPAKRKKGKKRPHDTGAGIEEAAPGAGPTGAGAEGEVLAELPPPSHLPKPDLALKEAVEEALAQWDEKAGDRAPKKVLVAPHDGVVIIKPTVEDTIVAKNKEIAKVADFSVLRIVLKLKGENQPHVRVGEPAKIAVRSEQLPLRMFWGDREGFLWRAERVQFTNLVDDATANWLRDELKKTPVTRDDGEDIPLNVATVENIKINAKLKTTPVAPQQASAEQDRMKPDDLQTLELKGHVVEVKHSGKIALNELPPAVHAELEKRLLEKFKGKVIEDPQPFRIDGFRSLAVMTTVKTETTEVPKNEEERQKAIKKARPGAKVDRIVDATIELDNPPPMLTAAVKAQYERAKPTGPRVDVDVVTERKRFAMLLFRQ